MLDLTGIMFSTIMMLIVVLRAVALDRSQPWFQTIAQRKMVAQDAKAPPTPVWRRNRGA